MDALGLYHTSQIADIHNKPKWQLTSKCKCKWQFTSQSVSWQLPAIGEYMSAPFYKTWITNKADLKFVKNFTQPDFQATSFTPQKCVICDIFLPN